MSSLPAWLLLFLASSLQADGGTPFELDKKLRKTRVEKDAHALAASFGEGAGSSRLENKAYAVEIDGRKLLFFDVDRDRKLTSADGVTFEGQRFVVPLPEELLLAGGQYAYRFEGTRSVALCRTELGLDPDVFPTVIAITEVRMRAGLKPLVIESEASKAARAHLDYLETNRVVRNRRITMDAHHEHPDRAGYSAEGALAGATGILGVGPSLTEDVLGWYASTFHGVKLLAPTLERIGIARRHGLSLVFPAPMNASVAAGPGRIQLHPPDGALDVPPGFSSAGEVPSPVPGDSLGAGTGFPLFVRLPPALQARRDSTLELRNAAGELVRGYLSTPSDPASPLFPRNMGCVFFIPATRLEDGEHYTASFLQEGMREPLTWSFQTWKWKPKRP